MDKFAKKQTDHETKRPFLRSSNTKQNKVSSFQVPRKKETEKMYDIAQDSTLQENKKAEKSEKNAKEKIFKNQNINLNEFKISAKENCQSKIDIAADRTLIKNKGFEKSKRKLDDTSEIKAEEVSENLESGNGKEDVELSKIKIEKYKPAFNDKKKTNQGMKKSNKGAEIDDSLKEDFKEASSKECNEAIESSPDIKTDFSKAIENVVTVDTKGIPEKTETDSNLSEEEVNEPKNTATGYVPFSNYFDIKIPVKGKVVFQNVDDKPFTKCYDLAVERNKRRFSYMKKTGIDDKILRMIQSGTTNKKKNTMEKNRKNINMACYVTELCAKILKELSRDNIRQHKVIRYFEKFLHTPVTPTCLLYVPHLVHTISFIRGHKEFSKVLRLTANECYDKCHAMFPVPAGYNFETVYTSEMTKFLPDDFDKMEDIPFDCGDIDDLFECSDSENSNADSDGIQAE